MTPKWLVAEMESMNCVFRLLSQRITMNIINFLNLTALNHHLPSGNLLHCYLLNMAESTSWMFPLKKWFSIVFWHVYQETHHYWGRENHVGYRASSVPGSSRPVKMSSPRGGFPRLTHHRSNGLPVTLRYPKFMAWQWKETWRNTR